jgi:hypothetical protein
MPSAPVTPDIISEPLVLPELPPLPDHMPAFDRKIEYTPSTSDAQPTATSMPDAEVTSADNQPAPAPKNPVGRPPKPLLSDAAWRVEQSDFAWAKSISRDDIGPNKDLLRHKVTKQIERNDPDLLQNEAFMGAFAQAFDAICQTYELAPTARQDILKSLLNGRVVENIAKSL